MKFNLNNTAPSVLFLCLNLLIFDKAMFFQKDTDVIVKLLYLLCACCIKWNAQFELD